jgi:hypothetical protein
MTAPPLRPVLTEYVEIHVIVVQMLIALFKITVPFALVKLALKEIQTLLVTLVRHPYIYIDILISEVNN